MRILSEYNKIKFDVGEDVYQFSFEEARGFVRGLQASAEKASLLFSEVVASRTTLLQKPDGGFRHEHAMWNEKGPFTAEQFLKIIQYPQDCLCQEWYLHMCTFGRLSPVSL